jgi:hypothetical protein
MFKHQGLAPRCDTVGAFDEQRAISRDVVPFPPGRKLQSYAIHCWNVTGREHSPRLSARKGAKLPSGHIFIQF